MRPTRKGKLDIFDLYIAWNIINHNFCVILGMKGLLKILKGAHRAPSCILNRQPQATRSSKEKRFIRQNQLQQHWNTKYLNVLWFWAWRGYYLEMLKGTGHLLVFWRGNPKLQETVKKKASYDKRRFNSIEISYISFFGGILAMKGLISVNAHLLYFE